MSGDRLEPGTEVDFRSTFERKVPLVGKGVITHTGVSLYTIKVASIESGNDGEDKVSEGEEIQVRIRDASKS